MDDAFVVEKAINNVLTIEFSFRLFFGHGEVGEHHAIHCCFDSGSNW